MRLRTPTLFISLTVLTAFLFLLDLVVGAVRILSLIHI